MQGRIWGSVPPHQKIFDFQPQMAHFDAHLSYSDIGLRILKFCFMCNKVEYNVYEYKTKDKEVDGVESGEWLCPFPPKRIFDDLVLKWHILMPISGILTYLF